MKRKQLFVYLLIVFTAFIIFSLIADVDMIFLGVFVVWLTGILYACSKLKKRLLLAVFLASFFVFLIGGHFTYEYFGMELNYYFGDEYYQHSNICLLVSLIALLAGFAFSSHFRIKRKKTSSLKSVPERSLRFRPSDLSVSKTAKWLFFLTYPLWVYVILDKVSFVQANSYASYFVEYDSNASYLVRALSAMTPYFLYLFLATMPPKKECKIPLCLYMLYAVVSVFTGRRSNLMIMLMFLLMYLLFRHYKDGAEAGWIKKKDVIIIVAVSPFLLIFLYAYNYLRMGYTVSDISLKEMFLGFFQQQGFSSSILRLGQYYEGQLLDHAYYSFFGIVKYFRTNSILKLIFNPSYDFSYLHNTAAFATNGNSLANALSYIVLWNYSSGAGVGSCYIAELYYDFGYTGVVLGNIFYGVIINSICKIWNRTTKFNVWTTAIGFAMVESFIKAPRWNFDIILQYFLDLGMWMAFAAVFIASLVISIRERKKSTDGVEI